MGLGIQGEEVTVLTLGEKQRPELGARKEGPRGGPLQARPQGPAA